MDRRRGPGRRDGARLPRARGDGPDDRHARADVHRAPPRTRGWTAPPRRRPRPGRGSPAHAGMDRSPTTARMVDAWLPRARGDGPLHTGGPWYAFRAPPRTRGWTVPEHPAHGRDRGSPAHAGMDRSAAGARRRPVGLPRARGDGPESAEPPRGARGAPPRTRGWTRCREIIGYGLVGSPAHAGMDRCCADPRGRTARLPRARGDGPAPYWSRPLRAAAPPRTRGWTLTAAPPPPGSPGSPAHAGMDLCSRVFAYAASWLPRARGDGPSAPAARQAGLLAPPRTRGWTDRPRRRPRRRRGSPAHAGMDPSPGS